MILLFFTKLFRTIISNIRQFAALVLVVVVAMALYYGLRTAHSNLKTTVDDYFKNTGFPDYIVTVPTAPLSLRNRIKDIQGVKNVATRIQKDVQINNNKYSKISGRLTSFNVPMEDNICTLYQVSGKSLGLSSNTSMPEIIMTEYYLKANGFTQGDIIEIEVDDYKHKARIIGVASSAELGHMSRKTGSFLEGSNFGPIIISTPQAQRLLNMDKKINQFLIEFDKGADIETLIQKIDKALDSYEPLSYVKKTDHPAIRKSESVVSSIKSVSMFFPTIFLMNAMVFLYILIRQLIKAQSLQIGILKALGFSNSMISSLYVSYTIVITIVGGVLGIQLGKVFLYFILNKCKEMLDLPTMDYSTNWSIIFSGMLICILVGALSGFLSTGEITRVTPLEAIKGRDNKFKNSATTKAPKILTETWKMTIRSIIRNKLRFAITTIGLLTASMLLFASFSFKDSKTYLIKHCFEVENTYDLCVILKQPLPEKELVSWRNLDGVEKTEYLLEAPVRLYKNDEKNRKIEKTPDLLLGWHPEISLTKPFHENGDDVAIAKNGIVLSKAIAEKLSVSKNERIWVETTNIYGQWSKIETPITDICDFYLMRSSYASVENINKLLGTKNAYNEVLLKTNKNSVKQIIKNLEDDKKVSYIKDSAFMIKQAENDFGGIVIAADIIIFCALALGFALIYNVSVMGFTERQREYAVFRVVGFSMGYIFRLTFNELLLQMLIAIPISIPLGQKISGSFLKMISSEYTRYPDYIYPSTYVVTVFCIIGFSVLAHLLSMLRVRKLDLMEATRVKE